MINHIKIDGFKNLSDAEFKLAPLTIVTGKNSTGKSTVLQSILLFQNSEAAVKYFPEYVNPNFRQSRNKYKNSKEIILEFETSDAKSRVKWDEFDYPVMPANLPEIEKNLFYLSANRIGAENTAKAFPDKLICGPSGEALFATFEREKSRALEKSLVRSSDSMTLSSQVDYWMSYILDTKLEVKTQLRDAAYIDIHYDSNGLTDLIPTQLGAGVSYLAKILIVCLQSKKGDVIMIENPEIHLYPLAQARLAEFLAFIAASGRQLIIETHSNDIITKARYEVYTGNLSEEDVVIYYKDNSQDPFLRIECDINGQLIPAFPESFFDATLNELLKMD